MVWAEGDEHRQQRKLLAPAFTYVSLTGRVNDLRHLSICSLAAVKGMTEDVIDCVESVSNLHFEHTL